MGEVVRGNAGDGVFTGRQSHISHRTNETLFSVNCYETNQWLCLIKRAGGR